MEDCLDIEYKLAIPDNDNFMQYLKFIEVGYIHRKLGATASPVVSLRKNVDDTYTFIVYSALRSVNNTFKLGEEFIEERADGVKVMSTIMIEGNKLIQVQVEQNGRTSTHVREFTPDAITVTTTADGWDGKCVRVYKRVVGRLSGA
ncbi:fatty acid-binding protein-like [Choristoneura fumiferana]|uniref:fatty acid-binding protein-like n=1 Tax=Choristoneura fumiferana TaxID=7141 RepID=UPI003D156257